MATISRDCRDTIIFSRRTVGNCRSVNIDGASGAGSSASGLADPRGSGGSEGGDASSSSHCQLSRVAPGVFAVGLGERGSGMEDGGETARTASGDLDVRSCGAIFTSSASDGIDGLPTSCDRSKPSASVDVDSTMGPDSESAAGFSVTASACRAVGSSAAHFESVPALECVREKAKAHL